MVRESPKEVAEMLFGFREKTGWSRMEAITELSMITSDKIPGLETIAMDQLEITQRILGRLETEQNEIPSRQWMLMFIALFKQKRIIDVDMANDWLDAAGKKPLQPEELRIIFGIKPQKTSIEMHAPVPVKGVKIETPLAHIPLSIIWITVLLSFILALSLFGKQAIETLRHLFVQPPPKVPVVTPQPIQIVPIPTTQTETMITEHVAISSELAHLDVDVLNEAFVDATGGGSFEGEALITTTANITQSFDITGIKIAKGEKLIVIGRSMDNRWYQLENKLWIDSLVVKTPCFRGSPLDRYYIVVDVITCERVFEASLPIITSSSIIEPPNDGHPVNYYP